jgi:hypothetical protein
MKVDPSGNQNDSMWHRSIFLIEDEHNSLVVTKIMFYSPEEIKNYSVFSDTHTKI